MPNGPGVNWQSLLATAALGLAVSTLIGGIMMYGDVRQMRERTDMNSALIAQNRALSSVVPVLQTQMNMVNNKLDSIDNKMEKLIDKFFPEVLKR